MKTLIIGFGSIGARHFEVLKSLGHEIDIVSAHLKKTGIPLGIPSWNSKIFGSLNEVKELENYDYFVIATPTDLHLENLEFLDKRVKNKIIFCEKPLFMPNQKAFEPKNKVFVGFVLRYHPLFIKLNELLENEKIILASTSCAQYLPTWRKGDYKKCYSASKKRGGGVLLDLSHEIDYICALCGELKDIKAINEKISDLEISSDDCALIIANSSLNTKVSINIDYISKITHRRLFVHTNERSFELDFIAGILRVCDKNANILEFQSANLERNEMFCSMHKDILGQQKRACDFGSALRVMKVLKEIKENK